MCLHKFHLATRYGYRLLATRYGYRLLATSDGYRRDRRVKSNRIY
jgi:hypothetical protein